MSWDVVIAVAIGLVVAWLILIGVLLAIKPDDTSIRDAVRLLPDVVRLVSRLARDRTLPRRIRVGLFLLLAYLVIPFDPVPDFIPVIGYADDAVVVLLVLRWVVRVAGNEALERHWPGTPQGLDALRRLARIKA
jgi:uncharacterized membrane protein YkvA (DUF1232 family)